MKVANNNLGCHLANVDSYLTKTSSKVDGNDNYKALMRYFSAMTADEKEQIRTKIDLKIKKTEKDVAEYKELTQPIAPENAIGRLSRMEAIGSKNVIEAALREAEAKLKNLHFMKMKIDDEDFGLCAQCKKEIAIPRLLFRPSSRLCVKCAQ